ncbi:1-aminocyclopropane-1-carboxylate synthase-like protein 1 [Golovinomyces cichoracearum]|uniref:1-aminocyclopropane-1-carboxylate synthase-like protein 1 n=1 Tax=Golovinomyces cichoracearum TaxID=62708 RepID=A0A420I3H2_9PEZI|nr:1-aminocyclopropane-1-carboxylate synthase-like protein 1 [Golovinomyces cichoracearum]
MADVYISRRGAANVKDLKNLWRFVPGITNKYNKDTNPDGTVLFGTAENCYIHEELEEFVKEHVQISTTDFTYSSCYNGGISFPALMASHLNSYFLPHTQISSNNIVTANGVTAVLSMLAFSIGDEGDAVLVSRPIYGRFEIDFKNSARLNIIYADMKGVDGFCPDVVERFEDELRKASVDGTRIKSCLITNPHNPLGQCYPRKTLEALMALCQRHKIHLISDELYALSVFSPPNRSSPNFTSVLSINPDGLIDPSLVHVLYGMSKDFGLAGLKIGCLITRNESIKNCCESILRFHSASGPSLKIASTILEHPKFVQDLLALSRERLLEGYRLTTDALNAARIPYYRGGNAGFFLYIDLSHLLKKCHGDVKQVEDEEFALAKHIWDHGVFLNPKQEHNVAPGWFRLVFASMSHHDLRIGLDRLTTAIRKIESKLSNSNPEDISS